MRQREGDGQKRRKGEGPYPKGRPRAGIGPRPEKWKRPNGRGEKGSRRAGEKGGYRKAGRRTLVCADSSTTRAAGTSRSAGKSSRPGCR